MAWLPTQVDPYVLFAWCALTGDLLGKGIMGFIGFGGLVAAVKSLWTLPVVPDSTIVTLRNRQRRYRTKTIVLGWFAVALFAISVGLYFRSISVLGEIGKVCEMPQVPHAGAVAIFPFLFTTIIAVSLFVWLQIRAVRLKKQC
jgi:hypothetical protein